MLILGIMCFGSFKASQWLLCGHHPLCQICLRCLASKGNADVGFCYTDISSAAKWRTEDVLAAAWDTEPSMAGLREFGEDVVAFDLLHVFHLGVLRDLLGSGLKLLCQNKSYYNARTIPKRLQAMTKEVKRWAQTNKVWLSLRKISKQTLVWKADRCPELRAKASDSLALLRFLSFKLQHQATVAYPSLVVCVWSAETFIGCLAQASVFLDADEQETAYNAGMVFIRSYLDLAVQSLQNGQLLFKARPKLHFLIHLVEDLAPTNQQCRNPFFDATFVDEDWIRRAMAAKKKMAHRTSALNILRRFMTINKAALDALRM